MNGKHILILILIIVSGALYYSWADSKMTSSYLEVIRIIDGDTVELEGNIRVRLLGINTPEKGMLKSGLAIEYLENNILSKKVKIVHFGSDKYGRILGYLFVNEININEVLLEKGFAHLYYYGKDRFYNEMFEAEKFARESKIGIWEESVNYECIRLLELKYNDDIYGKETLTLQNVCQKDIDVVIKDDATHIYKRTLSTGIYEENFNHIFNQDGDSLYVWDDFGLVEFYRY